MATPILNKKQQKSSLSAKKAKPRETIKNVVTTPYNNTYWPKLSTNDNKTLKEILEKNLIRVKNEKANIPWEKLKDVPKEDRRKFREEYANEEKISKCDSEGQIIGINDVTKLLEKNKAVVVLIAGDVQPRIMVQHVIDQCVLYRVPILVLDGLRTVLKSACGISGVALAFSKNINSNKQNKIKKAVKKMYAEYPPPTDHINFTRSLNYEKKDFKPKSPPDTNKKPEPVETEINEQEILDRLYLKRTSKDKRVFIPGNKKEANETDSMGVDSTGFMAFSQEPKRETRSEMIARYKKVNTEINKIQVDSTDFLAFHEDSLPDIMESDLIQIPERSSPEKKKGMNKSPLPQKDDYTLSSHEFETDSSCDFNNSNNLPIKEQDADADLIVISDDSENGLTKSKSCPLSADIMKMNLLSSPENPFTGKNKIVASTPLRKKASGKTDKVGSIGNRLSKQFVPEKKTKVNKSCYKSLKVKRLRGDPNRNKRKIAVLKSAKRV